MPAKPNPVMYQVAKLMKQKWFREFVVARSNAPDGLKYCDSIQSDVKDGRVALVSGVKSASLFVTNLEKSRKFFETCLDIKHLKTGEVVDHPHVSGRKMQVCALGFGDTPDLMLVRQTDASGKVIPVKDNGLHHVAFWIESTTNIKDFAKQLKRKGIGLSYGPVKHYDGPGGDGGWGGNEAVYVNDPDGHFIEFHNSMDPYGTQYKLRGHKK